MCKHICKPKLVGDVEYAVDLYIDVLYACPVNMMKMHFFLDAGEAAIGLFRRDVCPLHILMSNSLIISISCRPHTRFN
jgi:hypothetical protein